MSSSLLFSFLLALPGADSKPNAYPHAQLLLEPAELAKERRAGQFRILDVRPREKYLAGHIPEAIPMSPFVWGRDFATGQDRELWSKRIGDLGIDADMPVVVYGDEKVNETARIWWILRYWGVKDVRLLNGGWTAWQNHGGKVDSGEVKVEAKSVKLAPHAERLATKDQVLDFVKDKKHQIVDARTRGEFCGDTETAKRNGAIPGATHLEWIDVIDKKTARFKDPEELARLLKQAKIDPQRPAVTYCQSGGRAAVLAFTLELMGGKDVRNYYKSWSEWGNSDDTPVVKPKD